MLLQPSISEASKISLLIAIMAAINIIVVLPNHIKKFISPTRLLVPNTEPRKSIGSLIKPIDSKIELIGPLVENNAKNNIFL